MVKITAVIHHSKSITLAPGLNHALKIFLSGQHIFVGAISFGQLAASSTQKYFYKVKMS